MYHGGAAIKRPSYFCTKSSWYTADASLNNFNKKNINCLRTLKTSVKMSF